MISNQATRQILVVDDDPTTNRLMQKTLEICGYDVVTSPDGRSAMKTIGEGNFDAVLLDLMMPERDGFELCRLIRVNPQFDHVAVLTMSGMGDLPTIQRALSCGANDFITKPWTPEELILRISTAMRWMEVERELLATRIEMHRVESEFHQRLNSFAKKTQARLEAVESALPQQEENEWERPTPTVNKRQQLIESSPFH